jgi:hypothetical protein
MRHFPGLSGEWWLAGMAGMAYHDMEWLVGGTVHGKLTLLLTVLVVFVRRLGPYGYPDHCRTRGSNAGERFH